MRSAPWRPAVFIFAIACLGAGRTACGAPEPFPIVRQAGVDWIAMRAAAARFGLKQESTVKGRQVEWSGDGLRFRLQPGSREVAVNGLRLFLGQPVMNRGGEPYLSLADFDRRLLARMRPGLCRIPTPRVHVVAIDPGHGGKDHGAENRRLGLMEKTFTLAVSLQLKSLLDAAGFSVILTRDTDVDVPKATRAEIANLSGADVFVSVHFNSLEPDTRTTGVEVLTFPLQGQRPDASWSTGADDSEARASPVNRFDPWSAALAGALHRNLLQTLRSGDRGEKTEHLAVLRPLNCPGALVEPAFISNDEEARRLSTRAFQERIAAAIASGILDYAASVPVPNPPPQAPSTTPASPATAPL